MRLKCYTVYDGKVAAYLPPFYCRADGEAIRMFAESVMSEGHQFAKHPEDFTLFYIGEYDDETAKVECVITPVSLGTALEFLAGRAQVEKEEASDA